MKTADINTMKGFIRKEFNPTTIHVGQSGKIDFKYKDKGSIDHAKILSRLDALGYPILSYTLTRASGVGREFYVSSCYTHSDLKPELNYFIVENPISSSRKTNYQVGEELNNMSGFVCETIHAGMAYFIVSSKQISQEQIKNLFVKRWHSAEKVHSVSSCL